ncbi:MAG: phosphate signaling complex protein PhoU [Proteobacteria bacterium]|nr:phosphate signaling complex protein PhoU [Pseudomonadota bacterium]MDA0927559.1 phosphate signaling complex protein PhoU [Pseudomonadota bacterium]
MNSSADSHGHHISRQFNSDLEEVRKHMLEMGGLVEKQLGDALNALIEVDSGEAARVVQGDDQIDAMEVKIDEECNLIIARRQPAARDLRLVLAIIKAIRDLERIGDESSKIAKAAIKVSEDGDFPEGIVEFRTLGVKVQRMVNMALDAFVRYDADAALRVVSEDSNVDTEYAIAMRSTVTYMMEEPSSITRILHVLWALRAMERIGDHAKNICEHVVYMVAGTDIRHEKLSDIKHKLSG